MKYFVISDNDDTLVGLRLSGIEGERAGDKREVQAAVSRVMRDPSVGVLLITEKLAALAPELIYELKLNLKQTLVVEIPDRHGTGRSADSITRYIREAIGVKL
jgi:V/A-type H+-transporting ATPase subunit F